MVPAHNMKNIQKGFTLIEVMIFTTILSIVLVTAAAFTTRLVFNLRINEHRIYANIYATELLEWLGSEREANWNNIFNMATTGAGRTFCVNENLTLNKVSSGATTFTNGLCSSFNGLTPPIYKRELIMVRMDTNQVRATVRVSWQEEGNTYSEEIQTIYTSY